MRRKRRERPGPRFGLAPPGDSGALTGVSGHRLEPDALRRIRARYDSLDPAAFSRAFFATLFEEMPEVEPLMPLDLAAHGEYVEAAIAVVIRNLGDLHALECPLEELGAEHARRGIGPDRLAAAHGILMKTMRRLSATRWSAEEEDDWSAAFTALLAPMIRGAGEADRHMPGPTLHRS
jgi:hemoglobin-like flavoprotein